MKITTIDIIGQLERLAEACPWDEVDIWITRQPEGKCSFTAYVRNNEKYGLPAIFGVGENPGAAVDDSLRQAGQRDPDISRQKAIRELQEKIAKLQAVIIGLPPYRPNRELASIEVPATIEV